ncbi:IPT/TIG domain-containing protein [Engelhardtia mirabilis]|uniref:IPT/TIG domain-containing protein n=1 Tax=Engelhardtia mirabilis TaxID=2528011 RepID=A0A518BEF9_9BACT|nr:hypothetical protein Pla133_04420 [Planctomycetes bacterium Pla133]QDU99703.1 hypothetical protein Pla86_04420 [Planctomycetes bacterium Pla86]
MLRLQLALFTLPHLVCAASALGLQTVDRVVPQTGSPGDLVLIEGSGLAGIASVSVGLLAGPGFPQAVVPESVSDTQIWLKVPALTLDPGVSSGSGAVWLDTGVLTFAGSFFPLQQTLGEIVTLGLGTTPSASTVRPAISFDYDSGPPKYLVSQPFGPDVWQNNSSFRPTLHLAPPSAATFLAIGAPDFAPSLPMGDGLIALDLGAPVLLLATTTDAVGDASLGLPVPSSLSGTVGLQWFTVDASLPSLLAASNGFAVVF